jgi:hypothetical protein
MKKRKTGRHHHARFRLLSALVFRWKAYCKNDDLFLRKKQSQKQSQKQKQKQSQKQSQKKQKKSQKQRPQKIHANFF